QRLLRLWTSVVSAHGRGGRSVHATARRTASRPSLGSRGDCTPGEVQRNGRAPDRQRSRDPPCTRSAHVAATPGDGDRQRIQHPQETSSVTMFEPLEHLDPRLIAMAVGALALIALGVSSSGGVRRIAELRALRAALKDASYDLVRDVLIPDGMDGRLQVDFLLLTQR